MNALQLCNEPVAFMAGGQVLRFRRLSALRLDAIKQAAFTALLYERIAKAIDAMPAGSTADQRADKAQELRDAMPTGFAFVMGVVDYLKAPATIGVASLLAEASADGYDRDTINRAMNNASPGEKDAIMMHVLNSSRQQFWTDGEIRSVSRYMAREYGYSLQQIADMSDDQLFDMVPGLAESAAKVAADKDRAKAMAKPETAPEPEHVP